MSSRRKRLAPLVAAVLVVACGSTDATESSVAPTEPTVTEPTVAITDPPTSTARPTATTVASTTTAPPTTNAPPDDDAQLPITVTADVAYTSTQRLDVYAPTEGADWPVVVYFHGGNPGNDPARRTREAPTAEALAARGLLVYVPNWRGMGPAGGSEESICAIAYAHATAAEHGGDPTRVMPAGYSAGGYDALIHAFVGNDPPLPVEDCVVDPTIPAPTVVAAGGGPMFVTEWARQGLFPQPEWTDLTADEIDAFDPYLAVEAGLNPDLRIVLVVGENDVGGAPAPQPIAESNIEFDAAARAAGYDVELILLPGGHAEPTWPDSEQFDTWVETMAEAALGQG